MSEVHAAAQRSGLSDDEVIKQALRRFVGLEVFDELWSRNRLALLDSSADLLVSGDKDLADLRDSRIVNPRTAIGLLKDRR